MKPDSFSTSALDCAEMMMLSGSWPSQRFRYGEKATSRIWTCLINTQDDKLVAIAGGTVRFGRPSHSRCIVRLRLLSGQNKLCDPDEAS